MNKQALPTSLQKLVRTLQTARELTPRRAGDLLAQAEIAEADLLPWADFDHSSLPRDYRRSSAGLGPNHV